MELPLNGSQVVNILFFDADFGPYGNNPSRIFYYFDKKSAYLIFLLHVV
jgi:hypothetical protein